MSIDHSSHDHINLAGPGRLAGHVHQRDPAAADGAADIKRSETQSGHGGPGSATLCAWDRRFLGLL